MNKPKITGIHHITLKCQGVEEFNRTVSFYRDILGLTVVRTWADNTAAMLDTGAGIMEIFANAEDIPTVGAVRHFAFAVEDTDACVEAVRAAGYEITKEPTDIAIPSEPPYPARIAFCKGVLGEEIEFFHVK